MAETTSAPSLRGLSEAPVAILYRNWRGEVAVRQIVPGAAARAFWFGSTEWHPEPQWLITATDVEKNTSRDFALSGVLAWGTEAIAAREATLTEAVASARLEAVERCAQIVDRAKEVAAQTEAELVAAGKDDLSLSFAGERAAMEILAAEMRGLLTGGMAFGEAVASARAEGWQPIETAPKEDEITVDLWLVDRKSGLEWRQTDTWRHDGRWIVMEFDEMHHVESEDVVATNWRPALAPPGRSAGLPLPAPPATPGGRTDG